jgi:hypothetical protein
LNQFWRRDPMFTKDVVGYERRTGGSSSCSLSQTEVYEACMVAVV